MLLFIRDQTGYRLEEFYERKTVYLDVPKVKMFEDIKNDRLVRTYLRKSYEIRKGDILVFQCGAAEDSTLKWVKSVKGSRLPWLAGKVLVEWEN